MPALTLRTHTGKPVRPGKILGKGGEANVYHVEGDGTLLVKLYTDGKASQRLAKVQAMVADRLQERFSAIAAFPMEAVFDEAQLAGFTMRKVTGFRPLIQLTIPSDRKAEFSDANFSFLVRVALNLAKAVATLQSANIVIGDINESGALVNDQGLITMIDTDSFQYRSGGQVHRCIVGKAEYTPPELQGVSLLTVDRSADHDAFGLAVLIFELLFMGRHPFSGISKTGEQPTIAEAISGGRFAYSPLKAVTMMDPPPFMPVLADIPQEISGAFQQAFGPTPGRSRQTRPVAAEWVTMLTKMEMSIVECQNNPAHLYSQSAASCPWCRLEAGLGTILFVARHNTQVSGFNLIAVLARIDAVGTPGPAPDLAGLLGIVQTPAPSADALKAKTAVRTGNSMAIALAVIALLVTLAGVPLALIMFVPAGVLVFRDQAGVKAAKIRNSQAQSAWNDVLRRWQEEAGAVGFDTKRQALQAAVERLKALQALEQEMLLQIDRKKRDNQLRKHLEGARLAHSTVDSIGDGRKAILRSFGIETAWDVKSRRTTSVPGFGAVLTRKLSDWQQSVERSFRFNPNDPTDPGEIARIKNEIALRRTPLETELARGAGELEALKIAILINRGAYAQHAATYTMRLQGEADLAYLG